MSIAREILAAIVAELRTDAALAAQLRELLGLAPPAATEPDALYLAIPAYARRLGVSERTAWSWARVGLPCIGSGRTRRVAVREADAWLRGQRAHVDDAVERAARASARKAARGSR